MVGIWEGIVLYHFSHKTASTFDPYIACGVRLFIDIIFTGHVSRMVLVLLWTGLTALILDTIGSGSGYRSTDGTQSVYSPSVSSWARTLDALPRSGAQSFRPHPVISVPPPSSGFSPTPPAVPPGPLQQPFHPLSIVHDASETDTATEPATLLHLPPTSHDIPVSLESQVPFDSVHGSDHNHQADVRLENPAPARGTLDAYSISPCMDIFRSDILNIGSPQYMPLPVTQTSKSASTCSTEALTFGDVAVVDEPPPADAEVTPCDEPDKDRTPTNHTVGLPPTHTHPKFYNVDTPDEVSQIPTILIVPDIALSTGTRNGGVQGDVASLLFDNPIAQISDEDKSSDQFSDELESVPASSQTLADVESVISFGNQSELLARGEQFRKAAFSEERRKDSCRQSRLKASNAYRSRDAFLVSLEARKAGDRAVKLHKKAERRFFHGKCYCEKPCMDHKLILTVLALALTTAHNRYQNDATVDLHGLRVAEAIRRTEHAIRDVFLRGGGELRVIVGKGNHSIGGKAVLRPAVLKAMQQYVK